MRDAPAIAVRDIHKFFGTTHAVRGVSLTIGRGEVFGLLGPNGAGKSTLVKMILGLVQASAGTVAIYGQTPRSLAARRQVGFLPETFQFHAWAKAAELLRFHARLAGVDRAVRETRVRELLDLVGLSAHANERLSTFSKGMQQRIGLAQALIAQPPVVILDEPTSALDPIGRRDVRDLIRSLKAAGTTVFLNSHLLSEVEKVCDRVAIINRGQVVASGDLASLLAARELELRLGDGAAAALARLAPEFGAATTANGRWVVSVIDDEATQRLVRALVDANVPVYEVRARTGSLEDLFVRVAESSHL